MSVGGIRDLRVRILSDNKIEEREVNSLIREAEDGFLFIKNVSAGERKELTQLLEKNADRFEPGAREKLATFLGIQLVTPAGVMDSLAKLKSSMEAARDASGQVHLDKVAEAIKGDGAAEAALSTIANHVADNRPVPVSASCDSSAPARAPATISAARASSVFNALIEAKREVTSLDSDANKVLDEGERAGAREVAGLTGTLVKAAVDGAAKPKRVGGSC